MAATSAVILFAADMTDTPVETAPPNVRARYRHNMRWFLAAMGIFVVVCVTVAITG